MATTESDVNGAPVLTIEQRLEQVREVYTQGISDILDRCMDEFVLPQDQEALLDDAAQFAVYLLAIKKVEVRRQAADKKSLLAAYWPLEKAIKKEVPGMLLEFAKAVEAQGQQPGEPVQ
ncbi:MAG TPA: hypothetical protein VGR19_05940 [Allosphingosinicella sp.]|nr:hypothetical protein [Allosphingosinicella sp.]